MTRHSAGKATGGPIRDRVVELLRIRAGDLAPHPANWRLHPERQRTALRALLQDIGYADALLARREGDGLILIDGHLRQSLDPDQVVPVLLLDVSAEEADTLLATLDPLAALALPEPEALAALLERVETSSAAVRDLLQDLARSAGLPPRPVLSDPDRIPALPPVPRTSPGDLWMLGEHRLLCADATDPSAIPRVMAGERAHVLWTDPPYGVDYEGKTPDCLRISGDTPSGLEDLLRGAFRHAGAVLVPGARVYLAHPAGPLQEVFLRAFLEQGWRLHQTLVWVKDQIVLGHADYHYQHEPILYGYAPGPGRWGRGGRGGTGGTPSPRCSRSPNPRPPGSIPP